jgi:hypothetical protein
MRKFNVSIQYILIFFVYIFARLFRSLVFESASFLSLVLDYSVWSLNVGRKTRFILYHVVCMQILCSQCFLGNHDHRREKRKEYFRKERVCPGVDLKFEPFSFLLFDFQVEEIYSSIKQLRNLRDMQRTS